MSEVEAVRKLIAFDAARYLDDGEAIAEYMTAVFEVDDPDLLLLALSDKHIQADPQFNELRLRNIHFYDPSATLAPLYTPKEGLHNSAETRRIDAMIRPSI